MTAAAPSSASPETPLPRLLATRDSDRLRRYREYLDYYEGRRGAPPRRARERALTFNYARAIVEKGASYLVTEHRPVVTPAGTDADARRVAATAERLLSDTWDANDLARLDIETEIDTATLGDGAYKVTWDEREERVVVSAPDVQGLFVWWHGDDVRRVRRLAARYEQDAEALAERAPAAQR
ncbi:MAG: phage portal protein, partial [Dehalococcoidia bacterium]